MNKAQFDRWNRVRKKGKDHFVWMTGVLWWGLSVGLLYGVIMHLFNHQWKVESLWSMSFVSNLSFNLLFFAMAGFFWGRVVWRMTEKRYREEEAKQRGGN